MRLPSDFRVRRSRRMLFSGRRRMSCSSHAGSSMASRVVGAMDEQVARFVLKHNPGMELGDSPYTAIGNLDGLGNIIGGVVFNNYTKRDIHLHVAGVTRHWCSRRFLGEVFS